MRGAIVAAAAFTAIGTFPAAAADCGIVEQATLPGSNAAIPAVGAP